MVDLRAYVELLLYVYMFIDKWKIHRLSLCSLSNTNQLTYIKQEAQRHEKILFYRLYQ